MAAAVLMGTGAPGPAAVREVSGAVIAGTPALRAFTLALGVPLLAKVLAALVMLSYSYGRLTGFIRRSSVARRLCMAATGDFLLLRIMRPAGVRA